MSSRPTEEDGYRTVFTGIRLGTPVLVRSPAAARRATRRSSRRRCLGRRCGDAQRDASVIVTRLHLRYTPESS